MVGDISVILQERFKGLKICEPPASLKGILTIKAAKAADYLAIARCLKEEFGFEYLDFLTAVDWKGGVDPRGFIVEQNPNPLLPDRPAFEIIVEKPAAGFPYRETFEIIVLMSNWKDKAKFCLRLEIPRVCPGGVPLRPAPQSFGGGDNAGGIGRSASGTESGPEALAAPSAPSLTSVWKTADWQEREVYDLMGIVFEGHPNLKKILTPEFIQGHPLRKDYVHIKDKYD